MGTLAKKVATFSFAWSVFRPGGGEDSSTGSNLTFTVAMVVGLRSASGPLEYGNLRLCGCVDSTTSRPSFPLNVPFLMFFSRRIL